MTTPVIMPQLGESVVEGTVSRWLKQPGDPVTAYEPLLEVSTDKVDTEIPAPASGVLLQILVPEGTTVEHGTPLALIGAEDESAEPAPAAVPPAPNGSHQPASPAGHVTPVVARMAADHQIDLAQIAGTGRGGRVTKKDVEAYLAERGAAPAAAAEDDLPPWERPGSGDLFKPSVNYEDETTPAPSTPPSSTQRKPAALDPLVATAGKPVDSLRMYPPEPIPTASEADLLPLTAMRRSIADHMVRSKHTSPHVTTVFEVDMTAVLAHRQANLAAYAAQGVNLTLTAYFVTATVEALRAVPILNSRWTDEGIYQLRAIHIGIAVAIDGGLIVPVIRNAGELNLLGTARAVNDLAARARSKQLRVDEVQGGTFSISNHGVGGSLFATPIINQPQAGILGVGVMEKRVRVITDAHGADMIAIRPCCYLSLTFDHRIADGATADGFMLMLRKRLEGWS
ncbi:2-oxo acid dehydrogenase subunit E2 [Anaerolineae bacterium CFX9]|nr:2-oxo acid dehydrogenase subunit E2 [Anaerolineae bacterium CFX9]